MQFSKMLTILKNSDKRTAKKQFMLAASKNILENNCGQQHQLLPLTVFVYALQAKLQIHFTLLPVPAKTSLLKHLASLSDSGTHLWHRENAEPGHSGADTILTKRSIKKNYSLTFHFACLLHPCLVILIYKNCILLMF